MSIVDLVSTIQQLPPEKRRTLEDFAHFLLEKEPKQERKTPKFGSGKGMVAYMSDDFDEPLEDFKDYM
jgi:hypothetical protein